MRIWISIGIMIGLIVFLQAVIPLQSNPARKMTKEALGSALFFEKMLSVDSSISCASCHQPAFAYADTLAFSIGVHGIPTKRNTPSLMNLSERPYLFWDGRARNLEEQAMMVIQNKDEMGMKLHIAVLRLQAHPQYKKWFAEAFGEKPGIKNMAAALAAFIRTLETDESRYDLYSDDSIQWTAAERRGHALFVGKARCFDCHFSPDFTGDEFRNIGLFNGREWNDSGRFALTRMPADLGKFKTPGLRNIAVTAPYMHDGSFKTLEAVVAYYNNPGHFVDNPQNMDSLMEEPLRLSPTEQADLVVFLRSLTDKKFENKSKSGY
jgi:cytochrome c peroxidase